VSVSVLLANGHRVRGIQADVWMACGEQYFDLAAMEKLRSARQES